MYLRKPNISPHQLDVQETNVTIPQFYRVWNHSLDAGLRMDGLLPLDLRDMVIVVLRSTSNTERPIRPAQGDLCGTGDHSINKNKITTPTAKRKRAIVKCGLLTHQHTFFSRRVSVVHFWRQRSCHEDDYQRTKSNNETRVQNPQSCAWLVVRQNQLGTKDPNQTCWHQKPTCWHANQRVSRVTSGTVFFVCST